MHTIEYCYNFKTLYNFIMKDIPQAEKLTRRERRIELGRELLDCMLMRNSLFTGYPSELEQNRAGIQKLEQYANGEEVSETDDLPKHDPPANPYPFY
jgi:hypothetical protein